jgi:hypothetical protein
MAKHLCSTPGSAQLPQTFDLVDLDQHPDGKLLRLLSQATKLRDRCETAGINPYQFQGPPVALELWELTISIIKAEALTPLGLQAKAIFVMGDQHDPMGHTCLVAPFASVVRDLLRMGVPA